MFCFTYNSFTGPMLSMMNTDLMFIAQFYNNYLLSSISLGKAVELDSC